MPWVTDALEQFVAVTDWSATCDRIRNGAVEVPNPIAGWPNAPGGIARSEHAPTIVR